MRVEQALQLLPDTDDLIPLRAALIGSSRADDGQVWSGAEAYVTLETRLASAEALEAKLPAILEAARARLEATYRATIAALREMEGGDVAAAAGALIEAGEAEEGAGRLDAAERFFERAEAIGRRARDRKPQGLALLRLARVARARGNLDRSLELYRRGFDFAEAQRDRQGMVVACQGCGNVLVEQGRWEEAEGWYLRGVEIVGDEPSRELWQLESNLSIATRRAGRLEDSGRWLSRAQATVDRLGDSSGKVYVLNADGLLRVAAGDPRGAETIYEEALRQAREPVEEARVLVNLAESLLLQGRLSEAEAATRRLELVAITNGLVASLPYVYRGLGAVARARRDEEGFLFYEQALAICISESLPELEQGLTQLEYAGFEAALGRQESALARLVEAEEIFQRIGAAPEAERAAAAQHRLRDTSETRVEE